MTRTGLRQLCSPCGRRYKDAGGKSEETLEAVKHSKATLEAQLTTQRSLIENMRAELGAAKVSSKVMERWSTIVWLWEGKASTMQCKWSRFVERL
jgi:phage shock protein A